jgi:hypothetical protein
VGRYDLRHDQVRLKAGKYLMTSAVESSVQIPDPAGLSRGIGLIHTYKRSK